MKYLAVFWLFSFFLLLLPLESGANIVDFETTPSGALPTDDSPLTDPYAVSGGGNVRFFYDTNANNQYDAGIDQFPYFEQIGSNGVDGFENSNLQENDVARAGFENQLGSFFLRQFNGIGNAPAAFLPFIADYQGTLPITGLSGEIWDIDGATDRGTEQWRIEVLNASNAVLATENSPLGTSHGANSLDGEPWQYDFTNLPAGAEKVRITFIGSTPNTSEAGFGLNNLEVTTVIPIRGDINADGHVDTKDVTAMMQALVNESDYAQRNGLSISELDRAGDVNGDGKFTNADLQALLNLLNTGGGSTSVPEPSTFALLLILFPGGLLLRRGSCHPGADWRLVNRSRFKKAERKRKDLQKRF